MNQRREFIKQSLLAGAGLSLAISGPLKAVSTSGLKITESVYTLPELEFAYDALEPYIDRTTMQIHHSRHHQAYITQLNKAVQEHGLTGRPLFNLLQSVSSLPTAIRNHGGGHFNHSFFWKILRPAAASSVLQPGSPAQLAGPLSDAIGQSFGSFENFKKDFVEKAMKNFGSGWTWLVQKPDGQLAVGNTPNQDNPLMDVSEFKGKPLLGLDLWEHAYYLQYQNKRAEYIQAWWNIVHWEEVQQQLQGK